MRHGVAARGTPRRVTAIAFAVAYILCIILEGAANDANSSGGPDPWWSTALGMASIAALLVAVITLWTGARHAPTIGVVAGIGMLFDTLYSPDHPQHAFGWWTWVQLWWAWVQVALSIGVVAASVVIIIAERRDRVTGPHRLERPPEVVGHKGEVPQPAVPDDLIDQAPGTAQLRPDVQLVVQDDAIDHRHDA